MKQYKIDIAAEIIRQFDAGSVVSVPAIGETDRAVKFSEAAEALGYTRLPATDIREIVGAVTKARPELHGVRFVADPAHPNSTESLWRTLYITDLTLD